MDDHKENQKFALSSSRIIEKQIEKKNYLTINNCDSKGGCGHRYDSNNNSYNNKKSGISIKHGNIDREEVLNIVAGGDGEAEGAEYVDINSEARTTELADDLVNSYNHRKCKTDYETDNTRSKEDNATQLRLQKTPAQPLAAIVDTQTVTTVHGQITTQNLSQRHLITNSQDDILHGQQISLHNLLDADGSLCAVPMGAFCDMAAFSKLDCSPLSDLKDHTQNNQNFLAKKYYHPLYAHGVCRWPGCELPLDDMATFVKHLKSEHCLDDRSTAQARVQMQVVSQLEMHLQKERDRLQAMMHHLYLTKHFVMPEETQENISHIRYKNAIRSVSTTPDLNKNHSNSNDDSDGASDLQSLLINSGNVSATRKRICDKSPLALAGGLPYMLERAGLDVQQACEFFNRSNRIIFHQNCLTTVQTILTSLRVHFKEVVTLTEIQRNREFYKNADVRPPFTYASLIRQSIIESPDKQLTLNEIYNWFQNTFCYFRRNAATWKNAIRTNLSLHKCFVRYEDDFGSFWMVDDSEFVKRRHLSRGRPRKYEPSSSPNSNSQQFGSTIASATSSDVVDGGSVVNDAIATNSIDASTAGASSRQRCISSGSNLYHRSGNKGNGNENNGGNDDYDICEVSQRSPAGYQSHIHSGRKQYCGSKQRSHLQGSIIGIAVKTNMNSHIDHNRIVSRMNVDGGVVATENEPGVGGIGDIGSVGSVDVDNTNGSLNIANTGVETEDPSGYDFHTQSISNDAILNSPTGSKSMNGRYSPNLQNMWSFGSSLSDEATSSEFGCINNDRYRNFVTGLHLQSLSQRHHFHQHKTSSQRMPGKAQHQPYRSNFPNPSHGIRYLHQPQGYHVYQTNQDEQHQKLLHDQQHQPPGQDIFGVNALLSNTDKYFSHNEGDSFKHETFDARSQQQQHQQHLGIRHHTPNARADFSADELNHIYGYHHNNGHEIDVKYTPPHRTQYNFETRHFKRTQNKKRSAEDMYSNKTSDAAEEDSGIVDCDREEVQRKRRKSHTSSIDYDGVPIKTELESESELRNIDMPLRTKSY